MNKIIGSLDIEAQLFVLINISLFIAVIHNSLTKIFRITFSNILNYHYPDVIRSLIPGLEYFPSFIPVKQNLNEHMIK
jgi:hypothetical protein